MKYAALVVLLGLAFWFGRDCGSHGKVDQELRKRVTATTDSLLASRKEHRALMDSLNNIKTIAAARQKAHERASRAHADKAAGFKDAADALGDRTAPDSANPWYVVAMNRQREAVEERLARFQSDSALAAAVLQVEVLEKANAALLTRLITAEATAYAADTLRAQTEDELKGARRQLGILKLGGTLLVLFTVVNALR